MGNPFSIPSDPCINKVFDWLDKKVACIHNLEKNLKALETAKKDLKARREDLLRRVTREEDSGLKRLSQVQVWLTNAEAIENETDNLLRTTNDELQRLCLCGFCSKSLISSYRYGKRVILTLREVEKKLESDVLEVVAEQPETSEVQERQLQPIIVGQEKMLDEAWKRLKEDEVGIMGIYGMGGVGKTTLLTQLNNKFSKKRGGFNFVLWIVVSKELNLEKIQDEIAKKMGLDIEEWKQKEKSEKVDIIYNFLTKKKFMLFLDDIWEKVDLAEIGVPIPTTQNKCKVVFTTRSLDVCARMGVEDPMEVRCLDDDVAFDLFQKKVGKRTLGSNPEIPDLARIIAKKCCGLPLALNVIGETMSCKRMIQEWRHAIDVLNEYAREFSDMEDKILPLLKYSYDNLKGEVSGNPTRDGLVKSCLLYCALFPEDYKIPKRRLINYWICEGMIDGNEGIERAKNKGYEIIGNLFRASLLMEGVDEYKRDCVYMHDVVREMALWIASDLGKQKEAFIVRAGVGLSKMPKVENWSAVKRMSLMENEIRHLVGSPECLELTTLLLQNTKLGKISSEFFKSMPKLTVLDLSGNRDLSELSDGISELVSLQYLNLSKTGIHHLPLGGQGLRKLVHLDLRGADKLSSLAGISNLHNLKILKLQDSWFSWDLKTVEELETLEHLDVLKLRIHGKDESSLEPYLSSHRLTSCTQTLEISYMDLGSSGGITLPVTMKKLRKFFIWGCSISEIKMVYNPRNPSFLSLSKVEIVGCRILRELTFLMFAPNLKFLVVDHADQLENIINKEKACEDGELGIVPFLKLMFLYLAKIPELKSIYWRLLPFPCLKEIRVEGCPNLKKLPLDSQSGTHDENGLIIKYSQKKWIKGVEWEDQSTKTRFLSSSVKIKSVDTFYKEDGILIAVNFFEGLLISEAARLK